MNMTWPIRARPIDGAIKAALVAVLMVLDAAGQAPAQQNAPETRPDAKAAPAAQQQAVNVEQALYLIRSVLLTLNDANRSGNYTVLRDLAAPDFQARNTAADLGQIFADLRQRKFDL